MTVSAIDWSTVDWVRDGERVPDRVIAETLGVSTRTVHKHRVKLGIPSTQVDWYTVADLETAPVAELACRLGVDVTLVRAARRRFGFVAHVCEVNT